MFIIEIYKCCHITGFLLDKIKQASKFYSYSTFKTKVLYTNITKNIQVPEKCMPHTFTMFTWNNLTTTNPPVTIPEISSF